MFEKTILELIFLLQDVFSGLIFFDWNKIIPILNLVILIIGLVWGYYKLKKEIIFNKRLEVHEKLTNMLVQGLHKSFYSLSPFIMNSFLIKGCNPNDSNDYLTKQLQENSKKLIEKISSLQSDFQIFYEFFQFWKALFSEKIDNESKFIFDMHKIFSDDLWKYCQALSSFSMLSLMKDATEIEKEKGELIALDEKISKNSIVLSNGLDKFVSDMSTEIFGGLYVKDKNVKDRLFNLEVENLNDGDQMIVLTENGFKYRSYKKTSFQKKFGGFKEREEKLRNFLDQKIKI